MSRNTASASIELPFSDKYTPNHSQAYHDKHQGDLRRRLSNLRDQQLARRALALAGQPRLVLDLPCGAGRFWETLAEHPERQIIAADNSAAMLEVALKNADAGLLERIRPLHTSAFSIDLPDQSVDSIFCMRLMHHIGEAEHRLSMLREFHRVTRGTVILSLWVDGNYMSWRRKRQEERRKTRGQHGYQNRFVLRRSTVEAEFAFTGFDVAAHLDFLPMHSMWRTYVLRRS
ncbi:class I SAM-dependent methyltransferase [Pseudothauera nasutitermitis]|uniref:Class I SAM-dependent methyltransferase n=1 Tax=Pseudothauera nasutitermitis TaxID=2565930 RepID=A0A4S4AUH1_9RHOO|nr:class I SAM-dependent methyltransferase [Pseudothauera nasutitermitis]THF63566.1 class I SAM-dependent methyltransferase [Pseudothauera nasutitermitis]